MSRTQPPVPDEDPQSTAWPILVAIGIVGLVVLGVIVVRVVRGDEVRDEAGLGRAVIGQNDALQRLDYPAYERFTCDALQGVEPVVLAEQRQSAEAKGARFVDDVRGMKVEGDRASATVVYHFEKSSEDKITTPMSFAREDGEWTVCSPGPR